MYYRAYERCLKVLMQPINHKDGDRLDSLGEELSQHLESRDLIDSTNNRIRYAGVLCLNDELHIFWPKGTCVPTNECASDLRLYFRAIKKYGEVSGARLEQNLVGQNDDANTASLLVSILDDFQSSGLYRNVSEFYRMGDTGRINWKRTLNGSTPVLDKQGAPVYLRTVVQTRRVEEDLIRQLHRHAVAVAERYMGFILPQDGDRLSESDWENPDLDSESARECIHSEMGSCFMDSKLRTLNLLLKFFSHDGASSGDSVYCTGVRQFEQLWEKACSTYLCDQKDFVESMPAPSYIYADSSEPKSLNGGRPDIIIFEEPSVSVVDAKYYDFSETKPGWPDIVKQLFYGVAIQEMGYFKNFRPVTNFFLCPTPSISDESTPSEIKFLGKGPESIFGKYGNIKIKFLPWQQVLHGFVESKCSKESRNAILRQIA